MRYFRKKTTDNSYQKAVVKLSSKKVTMMKKIEKEANEHLEEGKLSHIKLVYGNRVYPKIKIDNPNTFRLKGVWINAEKKPYPQLWLE